MRGDKDYIEILLMHCAKIQKWMDGVSKAEWGKNEVLRDAVCMRLFAISDNIKSYMAVRKDLSVEYPEIPWDEIARFRDRTAHHYEGVDYDEVWVIVQSDLPTLLAVIGKIQSEGSASPRP